MIGRKQGLKVQLEKIFTVGGKKGNNTRAILSCLLTRTRRDGQSDLSENITSMDVAMHEPGVDQIGVVPSVSVR